MDRPQAERPAFLREACGDDEALRQEAESLIGRDGSLGSFLETPAIIAAVMTLTGRRLGPYEILERIGAGGMGEVYRARDTRLGRDVAIKTLPHDRLTDEARRRRFVQEARAASALNHPNIVTIHEIETIDGIDAIVMELVSGKNLSEVIGTRLKTLEILRIAIPIADALTRAHAAGIVHRDLKPGNIMFGADGLVKVLDFGLAKLVDQDSDIRSAPGSATGTASELSASGAVVGTPAYMSPEQAMGSTVDARSDIFSFGAVLYEMVAGSRAFPGHSVTETLDAVVNREPMPTNARRPDVPIELERLIVRCLRKDPSRRMQHMADVKVELVDLQEGCGGHPPADPVQRRGIRRAAVAALAVTIVGGIATAVALSRRSPPSGPVRLTAITTAVGNEAMPTPSPDGESVAFSWEGESSSAAEPQDRDIWITLIGTSESRRLTSGPEDDWSPSWSPDGRQIAFVRVPAGLIAGPGAVYVLSPIGGPARKIDAITSVFSQLSWSPDSRWIAVPSHRVPNDASSKPGGILLHPLNGGTPQASDDPSRCRVRRVPGVVLRRQATRVRVVRTRDRTTVRRIHS